MNQPKKEMYISVDIEATSPIPEEYSMFQLGACVVGDESKTFFIDIKMPNENYNKKMLTRCDFKIEDIKKIKKMDNC